MDKIEERHCIIVADDDTDDQFMLKEAFSSLNFDKEISTVENGEELLDYLHKRGKYSNASLPVPKLILLDLNMPKIDGRQCLKLIKEHTQFCKIPIIIFSTSNNPEDIAQCYELGANSYIIKPYSYNELVEIIDVIKKYWFSIVKIP
ncbi:MAG TPA: response regulator [Bacteroidia bacterium]|nr:response regulator [Bacteroidia bacterium]